ncbi:serine hydrolase [Enterococcus hermanniensis]|uniref:Beta-lactamase class A catalytic domain-containing protein n=1 Tax=Enterococcus hermanniensis TaxID=249189 RepID=A0A1L8TRW8_9ENTE|nr:serine hydrolase [Enterococcus hermanniensis]OJG47059.1 hypothetical protein RV04_GL000306 [Enterococcus hermanniensis]
MARHANPKKIKRVKSIGIGACFLAIALISYSVGRGLLNQPAKPSATTQKNPRTITKATSSSPMEVSTTSSSLPTMTNSSEQTKEAAKQLDASKLQANANPVYYGVYYFDSGKELSSNNSAPTVSASVIKVFIMEYALTQANSNEEIEGSSLMDWLLPMIQQSDNAATNALITHFGMEKLNHYFQTQGYPDTRLERLMLDNDARAQGKENYTSLTDCMTFLKRLYQQRAIAPYSTMLEIMEGQTVRTKIPSKLPTDVVVANKTGELDTVENDIGLVLTKENPFAIVVLTQNFTNTEAIRSAIGDFSLAATTIK